MIDIIELCEPLRFIVYDMYKSKVEAQVYVIEDRKELFYIKEAIKEHKLNGFIKVDTDKVAIDKRIFYKVRCK